MMAINQRLRKMMTNPDFQFGRPTGKGMSSSLFQSASPTAMSASGSQGRSPTKQEQSTLMDLRQKIRRYQKFSSDLKKKGGILFR